MIREVVEHFYGSARRDPELGPIFAAAVEDWDAHFDTLCDFWSSVLLMSGRYHGTPMQAHARLEGLEARHFARWLELFETTVREICPPAEADLFLDRAQRIARSLEIGIAVTRGELPPVVAREDGAS